MFALVAFTFIGASFIARFASAAPFPPPWGVSSADYGSPTTAPSGAPSFPSFTSSPPINYTLSSTSPPAASATSGDSPFSYPLSNTFPNITNPSPQLQQIELQAHGTLRNGPRPASLGPQGITNWQTIAFNELVEVAFFTELLANVTNDVPGYQLGEDRQLVIDILTVVQGQEELHQLNANGALIFYGDQPIQPCKYEIPVTNFNAALALASTFTDLIMGTLQDIEDVFGTEGGDDVGFLRGIASVIGQEGEQNGFYRLLQNKVPSALPFLTTSARAFAFSAYNQMFVVKGSCPNIDIIDLPIFGVLKVLTENPQPTDQNLQFSFSISSPSLANGSSTLSLVYINQQNLPVVEVLQNVRYDGSDIFFEAFFPYTQFEMNGLTIAAVTNSSGPFATADDVASATLFGPGLIEIN